MTARSPQHQQLVQIRPATPSDRKRVIELLVAQLREHDITTPATDVAAAVDRILRRPSWGCILVATMAKRRVGVAGLSFAWPIEAGGQTAWLEELYVEPAHREHGIGRALLRAAFHVAAEAGAESIDLEIIAGHERAAHLYRREGFRRLPRTHYTRRLTPAMRKRPSR